MYCEKHALSQSEAGIEIGGKKRVGGRWDCREVIRGDLKCRGAPGERLGALVPAAGLRPEAGAAAGPVERA